MKRTTTCRICEAACGLIAEVDPSGGIDLTPDPDHPVSRGHACVKGTRFVDAVYAHPDRLATPRIRGRSVRWADALTHSGSILRRLIDTHGPESVGIYSGNAAGHQLGAVLGITALQRALGTTKHYSCLTLDNSEMFVVAEAVFGTPGATFVADYAGSDCVVLIGTDPLASQASQAQSHPRAPDHLRDRGRAGQLIVVDPRRSVTAAAAGDHLAPRVGTDVFWLAGLVRHLDPEDPDLRRATASFTPERVSRVTGLSRGALEALYGRLMAARRPLLWSGLGVLLGPHGTLGWWLTVVSQALLGGLDRPGGWRWQPGAVDLPAWMHRIGLKGQDPSVRSPAGDWPAILGTLPAATLADDVLGDRPDRLRGLVVVGGDPASALPETRRAHQALEHLEHLVAVDLFENTTGSRADVLLPAATWLERSEIAVHTSNQRPIAHLRHDRAVVAPRGQARTDWRICIDLCHAIGRPAFGSRIADLAIRGGLDPVTIGRGLTTAARIPWRAMSSPRGHVAPSTATAPAPRLAIPVWCAALADLPDPEAGIRLITSVRPLRTMNHWIRAGGATVAFVHPDVAPAGPARLTGPGGSLDIPLVHDPTLAPDTVVLPFGEGTANPNRLIGTDRLETFTGQPVSNGAQVTIEPLS